MWRRAPRFDAHCYVQAIQREWHAGVLHTDDLVACAACMHGPG